MDLSIIVPVHNGEKFIEKCIESIGLSKLSEKSIEVLIIDDGSTDESIIKIKHYTEKYSCLKLFTKKNGGVSSARNYGISLASGKWLMFLDCDDKLNEGWLDIVESALKTYSQEDFIIFSKYFNNCFDMDSVSGIYSALGINKFGEENYHINAVFSKLFKKDIIECNKLRFIEGLINGEDSLFVCEYILHAKNIKCVNQTVYLFTINMQSSTNVFHAKFLENESLFSSKLDDIFSKCIVLNCNQKDEIINYVLVNGIYTVFYRASLTNKMSVFKLVFQFKNQDKYEKAFTNVNWNFFSRSKRVILKITQYSIIVATICFKMLLIVKRKIRTKENNCVIEI